MKIEIRSAQRGKITKNQHHKDTGIYGGKWGAWRKKSEESEKWKWGWGQTQCETWSTPLHVVYCQAKLIWDALTDNWHYAGEETAHCVGSATLICSSERGRVEQYRTEGAEGGSMSLTRQEIEPVVMSLSLSPSAWTHTSTKSTNTQTHTAFHNSYTHLHPEWLRRPHIRHVPPQIFESAT